MARYGIADGVRTRHRRLALVAVFAITVMVVALAAAYRPAERDVGDVEKSWPGWGFTHTQFSADDGGATAMTTAENAVKALPMVQAQHIMGWGAENPEPVPDEYNFATLDRRMAFIERTDGIPVIVLCCAPDWMKGGHPGETNWDRLEEAPFREHFADFTELSVTIAKRYPYVRHFIVWNEFKGFFDDERNRWEAEKYTDLYNAVYDALKAVNPDNRIGGPYLDFDSEPLDSPNASPYLRGPWGAIDQRVLSAFNYWLLNRNGADFVVVDGHATTDFGARDEFAALQKFRAVGDFLRRRVDAPIWWAEWYVEPATANRSPSHEVALRVAAMIELASTGADTVLYWNPRPGGPHCVSCLWTDTWSANGGRPLPFLTDLLQSFVRAFPPHVERRKLNVADGLIALKSERALLVVNTTDAPIAATVDDQQVEMSPYETRWVMPPP